MKELQYEQIRNTELWALFERKCAEQNMGLDFITAVGSVCNDALDLSQYIIHFFPTFTLHNDRHSANVCRWMYILLGDMAEKLNAQEAAMLLMAACCHDIGMSVSDAKREEMCSRGYPGWDAYFARYLDDDEEYHKTEVISEGMLRNFVRVNHHERIGENLKNWPSVLVAKGVKREDLLTICRSHGTDLDPQKLKWVRGKKYDMMLCAVLLRLADLLDYDAGRAPEALFRHMGLDDPKTAEAMRSADEFGKNQAGTFDEYIEGGVIRYNAVYSDPQLEQDVQAYLDWVEKELDHCAEHLSGAHTPWDELCLPHKISTEGVERQGYAAGKFHMTMDQDKVIELLAGKNLYPDPGVFVRELLQNSIDAVLMRAKQEKDFTVEQGRIIIDTWPGETGDTWFRIRDNGTGMNEHIINNYFLKVGRSYYTSDEFRAANRRAVGGAYTAISRFGIGILSCFMTDPDYTELKVSTKRFGERDSNGIRLDVTGLHGYYYLAREAETLEKGDFVQQMPSPDANDRGYRTEPGTTICVRTNLFRMGSTKSFREILDKYVQFPEVRVEHNGPEGHKAYPTQQELMDAVHALNPGGVMTEHIHEISSEALKTRFFLGIRDKIAIVLKYLPLDWLSDSEKMTGMVLTINLRTLGTSQDMTRKDSGEGEHVVKSGINRPLNSDIPLHFNIAFQLLSGTEWSDLKLADVHDEMWCINQKNFETEKIQPALSKQEQMILIYLSESLRRAEAEREFIAYNGVLTAGSGLLLEDKKITSLIMNNACVILLLREDYVPEVNIARDTITQLPPEAACSWVMAAEKVGLDYKDLPTPLLSERRMKELLMTHPAWSKWLFRDTRVEEVVGFDGRLVERLGKVARKQEFSHSDDFCKRGIFRTKYSITNLSEDDSIADFPVGMFFLPQDSGSPLAFAVRATPVYNRAHPFSQWLIKNRDDLEKKLPAVYDTLIQALLQGYITYRIRDTVNAILTRLRSFEGNYFGIHDDLFLTDEDFT